MTSVELAPNAAHADGTAVAYTPSPTMPEDVKIAPSAAILEAADADVIHEPVALAKLP